MYVIFYENTPSEPGVSETLAEGSDEARVKRPPFPRSAWPRSICRAPRRPSVGPLAPRRRLSARLAPRHGNAFRIAENHSMRDVHCPVERQLTPRPAMYSALSVSWCLLTEIPIMHDILIHLSLNQFSLYFIAKIGRRDSEVERS